MLIYFDGTFVQFIEGPKNNVDFLFETLLKDQRHQDVILLIEGASKERAFEDWSMAFKELSLAETVKIIGQKEFKKEDLFKGKNPDTMHPGLILIKSFVNNLHI